MARITELEKNLFDLFATTLNLMPGQNFFRGRLPAAKCDVTAMIIDSPGRGNTPAMPRYDVQILARFLNYSDALDFLERLDLKFPLIGNGFYILKSGKPAVYNTSLKGREVFGVSLNLDVRLTNNR